MSSIIQVFDSRNGTFNIICTATGGRPTTMSVTGPSGDVEDIMDIVQEGRVVGVGNDSFPTTSFVQGGINGDSYNCTASNGVSSSSSSSLVLKGVHFLLLRY